MITVRGNTIEFRFYRPGAREVHLLGDFNGWRHGVHRMSRDAGGYWTATLELPAGLFKFRYCADGQWFTDYAAFGIEPGPYGFDSVARVHPRPQPARRADRPAGADKCAA